MERADFNGNQKGIRFTATIILPNEFVTKLESEILYRLSQYTEHQHDEYLAQKKELWIDNLENRITEEAELHWSTKDNKIKQLQ